MSTSPHRTIVEDDSFSGAFNPLKISHRRLDEVLIGVHVALCMRPEICIRIEGTVLSMIKTREFPGIPALRIFFTYTDEEVHLRHVEVIQGGEVEQSVG